MALNAGTRLGTYEITALLGAGGMGEVYRARDARLNRDVAIKVLPDALADDPDRLARFQREAHVLASLNHPNIGAIYGLEESGTARALVLELVDGPTLADRIAEGPLPLDETLSVARQVADALEAAHDQGILHRDLKPANIKLTKDGRVKVLDFGLAKALEPVTGSVRLQPDLTASPTITSPAMTLGGVILGTAAYMSPEQAKGKPVDKRSDVWAFGCVLYEMLTSRRPFAGEDVTDTIVAVLSKEPDWTALPSSTPEALTRLLRRTIEKDRKRRLSDIADARLEIDEAGRPVPLIAAPVRPVAERRGLERAFWAVAVLIAAVTGAAMISMWRENAGALTFQFEIFPAANSTIVAGLPEEGGLPLAVSPDGTRVVFVATTADGTNVLWLRPLDALTAQPMQGTEGASSPFWSPDSRWIAFFADRKLKKISASGGPPTPLCDAPGNRNGTWGPNGSILFSPTNSAPIQRVSEEGGIPVPVTVLAENETGHVRPTFLPDGRHFLYSSYFAGQTADVSIYLASVDSPARKLLVKGDTANVAFASGHVLFVRETTLMAQRFDVERLALDGEPFPIVENVLTALNPGFGVFSASTNGVLVYQAGSGGYRASSLRWVDRSGKEIEEVSASGNFIDLDLSHDGKFAAVTSLERGQRSPDIWIYDLQVQEPANEDNVLSRIRCVARVGERAGRVPVLRLHSKGVQCLSPAAEWRYARIRA